VFGRGVTLVFSADETAREVAETLERKGIANASDREGAYRFLTTGDPAAFAEMGKRFLQLPIGAVEHVTVNALESAAASRVPRASLAVPGRREQYGNTGPESRVPRAASGAGGGRLRRPGAGAGEGRA
jgi:hypothetical protein